MKINKTGRFIKSFDLLETSTKNKAIKQFGLFVQNLFHPSLHTEKLEPKGRNIWSFRIDRKYRVIFTFCDRETILLLDIGSHDIYKNP